MPRAIDRRSTSGSSATFLAWTRRICSRPFRSGFADRHLAIEAARPQQRRIEDVRPVGRGDDDDALVGREAVHLDEQLVQRLLALFVAERVAAAAAADGVELVDEDDAGGVAARVLEQLADARRADAGDTSRRSPSRWRTGTARPPRRQSTAPAASCRCPEGRRAARPSGCVRRSPRSASGSRRKSTISFTSSLASSTPATSAKVIGCARDRPRASCRRSPECVRT